MIDLVVQHLAPQCGPLAINANGDAARFADLALPVLPDSLPDHPGPLAGVLAGLDWAASGAKGADAIVTVAADTPFFPPDLVARLRVAAGVRGLAIAASRDAAGHMRVHPTFGLWPLHLRGALRAALLAGERRVGQWALGQGAAVAEFESLPFDPFFNINTPEDIAHANRLAATRDAV